MRAPIRLLVLWDSNAWLPGSDWVGNQQALPHLPNPPPSTVPETASLQPHPAVGIADASRISLKIPRRTVVFSGVLSLIQ